MKYSSICLKASAVFLLLAMCGVSFAISADDFIPPVQEDTAARRAELLTVRDDSSVQVSRNASLDAEITAAPTLQDAINAIITKPKQGCQFAGVTGYAASTIVATGMGTYNPNYENVMAYRIEQRNAYVIAFMRAKSEMARTLSGISFEGAAYFEQDSQSQTTSAKTLNNLDMSLTERLHQWSQSVLKGYVTYAVQDDGKGRVYVTLVSTPKTRGQVGRVSTDGITASDLRSGLNALIAEIKSGLVPPVGGRIIEVPATGEIAWVGFGSSIVRHDSESDVQAELELQAEQVAELRAVDGLAGIILGDTTRWEAHADEATKRQIKSFETLQRDDPTTSGTEQETRELETRRREMRNTLSSSETVSSLRRGTLPPGITPQTDIDADGYFAYGIAVYLPSASDRAAGAKREMDTTNIVRPLTPPSPHTTAPSGPTPQTGQPGKKLDMKRGPSGVVEQNL